jgi:phage repressor protein C with HTH and peptisase S24 domain
MLCGKSFCTLIKMIDTAIMRPMKTVKEIRLENARSLMTDGPAEFARRIDSSTQQVNQVIGPAPTRNIGDKLARRIETAFGRPEGWLDVQHGLEQNDVSKTSQSNALIRRLLPEDQGNLVTWENPEDLEPDDDRVWIDRYDYRYSAGNGVIQWEVRQKKALPFDVGFFKALGVRPQDCKLAQVHGRSMEPYLFNRDMMMICTAKTRVRDGQIYAVTFEDEPLVKQIFKEPEGALRLHSYNPEFPDKIIAADQLEGLQIAGEVVYRSGSGLAGGN